MQKDYFHILNSRQCQTGANLLLHQGKSFWLRILEPKKAKPRKYIVLHLHTMILIFTSCPAFITQAKVFIFAKILVCIDVGHSDIYENIGPIILADINYKIHDIIQNDMLISFNIFQSFFLYKNIFG